MRAVSGFRVVLGGGSTYVIVSGWVTVACDAVSARGVLCAVLGLYWSLCDLSVWYTLCEHLCGLSVCGICVGREGCGVYLRVEFSWVGLWRHAVPSILYTVCAVAPSRRWRVLRRSDSFSSV